MDEETSEYAPLEAEYNKSAAAYDRRWKRYLEWTEELTLARIELRAGDRILDAGCGAGRLLEKLGGREPGQRLTGIDLSEGMLDRARQRLGSAVSLHRSSLENMPFASDAFDAVVSVSVWHYLRRPAEAIGEVGRVLRPGGRLVVTDWSADFLSMRGLDLWLRLTNRAHVRTWSSEQFERLLRRSGFSGIRITRHRGFFPWGCFVATAERCGG